MSVVEWLKPPLISLLPNKNATAEAAASGATALFVVFGDFVVHLPSAPPCLCARIYSSSIQQRGFGTLTRPASKSYVFYGINAANNLFPVKGKGIVRGKKKAATSFREAAAYYTGKNLLSHGMLPHYHRRLGA